jgi:hypothetical protein
VALATSSPAEDEDVVEDEHGGTDIEAGLDVVLRERVVGAEQHEDRPSTVDTANVSETTVLPKQPGEFVCGSCFLVKRHSQLAHQEDPQCCDCVR